MPEIGKDNFVAPPRTPPQPSRLAVHAVKHAQTHARAMVGGRGRGRPNPAPTPDTHSSTCAFPRMPIRDIIDDMAGNYNHVITAEALKAPTPEDVRGVLLVMLDCLYEKGPEEICQPAFGTLDGLEYPDLHEDSAANLKFFRACQKMFAAAQYPDFSMRDLFAPEKVRFTWQVSALINLAKFRATRHVAFQAMATASQELAAAHRQALEDNAELEHQITIIEEARAEEEGEVNAQKEAISQLAADLATLHRDQVSLTEETRDLKAKLIATTDAINAAKVKYLGEVQDVDKLRSQVVSSPDRVKGEIDDMAERLELDKENLQGVQRRTRHLHQRAEGLNKAAGDVVKVNKVLEEAVSEMDRTKALKSSIKEHKSKIAEFETEQESLKSAVVHLERQGKSIEQRLARVRQQRSDISDKAHCAEQRLAEQSRQVEAERKAAAASIDSNERRADELTQEIEQLVTVFSQDLQQAAKSQEALYDSFTSYHMGLSDALGYISADNAKAVSSMKHVQDQ